MSRSSILNEVRMKLMLLDHRQKLEASDHRGALIEIAALALSEVERMDSDSIQSNKV